MGMTPTGGSHGNQHSEAQSMENQKAQTDVSHPGDPKRRSSMWELLLLIYFLLLLGCGIWLITWGAPGSILAVYGTTLVVSIAGLFARKHIFGIAIDRRNYIDLSRAQWLGRRGRSRTQDTRGQ
jgi:hypothetical protein